MLKQTLAILSCSAILSASTTMCYKKNHLDPGTIEYISLDGGKCDGKFSVLDMKGEGYIVDSMKIHNSKNAEGLDYIYIFKKDSNTEDDAGVAISAVGLKAQLKQLKDDEKKQKEIDDTKLSIENGKKLYQNDCIECHGEDARVEAYNSARALGSLTLEDMQVSIRDYNLEEKDNGMAILMKPYADSLMPNDIEDVYNYIQTLNY